MDIEQLKTYTSEDFILDDTFREIIHSGNDAQLKEIIQSLPGKKDEIRLAVNVIKGLSSDQLTQKDDKKRQSWEFILQHQRKSVRLQFFRYAASFLVIVGIGLGIFYLSTPRHSEVVSAFQNPTDNAILVLADGKRVSIDSKQSTVQYSSDGLGIMVNDTAGVAQPVSSESLNQLIVPFGKRSFITLSEGTKVWINSGSKLIFPPVFKGKTREVMLEGEAFFEVTKDEKKPFFVKTDGFKLKVYGTKFNIQAYKQDANSNVVLVEGKISMNVPGSKIAEEVFMQPNQKASVIKGNEDIKVTHVENIEVYTAWIDGYLAFTNEDISVLLRKVSRYYNVDIEVDLPLNWERIYGKLDLKDDLERVLDGIAFISKTKYIKQDNKYIFTQE